MCEIGDRQTINMTIRCGCGRFFNVNPLKMSATEIKKPERLSSSGDRFY